jgi:hypothetical protein
MQLHPRNHNIYSLLLLCAGAAACFAFGGNLTPALGTPAAKVEDGADVHQKIFEEIDELIKQYYPRAKTSHDKQKLHVEYKVHTYQNLYSGRTELAPDVGGILGEFEFKSGTYKGSEPLPKTQNQYSYMLLLMAPYLAKSAEHLSTRLCYAPDAAVDFVNQFTSLLNEVGTAQSRTQCTLPPTIALPPTPLSPSSLPTGPFPTGSSSQSTSSSSNPIQSMSPPPKTIPIAPQTNPVAPQVVSTEKPGRRLFFWKATRGQEVVYLLGTVHIATANFYPLAPEIDEAFDESKQLAVEVAIDRHSPDRKMIDDLVKNYGTYKSPDRLSKHLSPDTKKVLDDYLKWAGETMELYEQSKPWYVTELIQASAPRRGEVLKMKSGLGLDRYFLGRAQFLGTKVVELETIDSQLHLHANLSEQVQDKLLQVFLLEYKDSLNEMKGIFDVWLAGDPDKLDAIINRTVHAHPELAAYNSVLLDQRNAGMATKIEQMSKISNAPVFVAVGSAHLLGETGLIASLKKFGYDVQQVYSSGSVNHPDQPDDKVFWDERFRVWLPKEVQKKYDQKSRVTQFELADDADQRYAINIVEIGSDQSTWRVPGPQVLDALLAVIKKNLNGTVTSHHSSTVQDFACRQIAFVCKPPIAAPGKADNNFKNPFFTVKNPAWFNDKLVLAKAYLVGTKVYFQIVCGNKQFIESPSATKFMNSIKFIR